MCFKRKKKEVLIYEGECYYGCPFSGNLKDSLQEAFDEYAEEEERIYERLEEEAKE